MKDTRVRTPCGCARLMVFAVCCLLLAIRPAWAACTPKALEIPVRIVNSRPVATMKLEGVELTMLVDSGAFYSLIPESTATQLKLPVWNLPSYTRIYGYTGAVSARLAKVRKVEFQGVPFANVEFLVGGNELGSGIDGVLGRNFLAANDTEYDLAHGIVRLIVPTGECGKVNFAYWAAGAPVIAGPMDQEWGGQDSTPRVTVQINGKKFSALLDTGAPRTAMRLSSARAAGIKDSDLTPAGSAGGAGAGRVSSWTGRVASFEIGGEKIDNVELSFDDVEYMGVDLLIGLDYFLSHRVYLSQLQKKFYATWNGGSVFARGGTAGDYDARFAAAPAAAEDASGLALRAAAAVARGDQVGALEALNRACELAPQAAEHRLARARVRLALDQRQQALDDLDEALRLQPALDQALGLRAAIRLARDDRGGALADLGQLDALLPPTAPLRLNMADLYARLDLAPQALRQWDLWLPSHRNDINRAHALNGRCWLRARIGLELDKALEDCEDAVRLNPADGATQDSLGWTHLRLGNTVRARWAFDAALERGQLPWSLYGRSLAYRQQGKLVEAQRDLDAARKLKPQIDDEVRKAGFPVADDAPRPATAG